MTANVLIAFRDRVTWILYAPGDAYDGDADRVSELASQGLVDTNGGDDCAVDLWSLTNLQLAEMCRERGIEPPKKAKKGALVALLSE